ncbi:hypothetical protein K491DRAFT_687509 [Lophiostoma macrostomum CBS 122681]|uniref:Heterokaryon incompatibility domain-containing protein n=1 Tax=Lophiostoma macrostomum CBS 122681 TaxID=1314788 RepID=A0A6A6TNI2_9PLEO|nr:hypothetical protein K491DRAFT_687509 [Lophiostoma macrostomum CBS 122681]
MRFINTTTFELQDVYIDAPGSADKRYAILSHRWSDNELDYQTYMGLDKSILRGKDSPVGNNTSLGKIWWACHVASQQKLPYLWIDTCCINKQDIPELDRSIRSMFSWYEKAAVCYAYLASATEPVEALRKDEYGFFDTAGADEKRKPKEWFTRGWRRSRNTFPSGCSGESRRTARRIWSFDGLIVMSLRLPKRCRERTRGALMVFRRLMRLV